MSKPKRSTRSMRNSVTFLVTFLIFLVLFGGVMIWGVSEFWRQTSQPAEDPAPTPTTSPGVGFTAEDARRLLLITENNGEAQGFVLLCADPFAARIQATAIPRETAVTTGTTQTRLFELYRSDGTAAVTAQVAALMNCTVDNTAVITYDNLQKLVTHLGDGVIFTLSESVQYQTADGATVTMKSGARTLSALQVTDLLQYTGWNSGRRGRAEIQAELAAAVINQYLLPSRFDDEDTDFHAVMNLWRSDILASQFVEFRESLLFLARQNQNNICTVVFPAGEFVGAGDATRFEWEEAPGT